MYRRVTGDRFIITGCRRETGYKLVWCRERQHRRYRTNHGCGGGNTVLYNCLFFIFYVMPSVEEQQFISFSFNAEIVVNLFAPAVMWKPHQCILGIMWMFFASLSL